MEGHLTDPMRIKRNEALQSLAGSHHRFISLSVVNLAVGARYGVWQRRIGRITIDSDPATASFLTVAIASSVM